MGTEGERRRNRTRRLRKKELKRIKVKWDISVRWLIVIILVPFLVYKTYTLYADAWKLYDKGVTTTAFACSIPKSNKRCITYEFYINNKRYTGRSLNGKVGEHIEIKYLEEDPSVNKDIETLENRILYLIYKRKSLSKEYYEK